MEQDLEKALKMLDLMCPEEADVVKAAFLKIDKKLAQHEDSISKLQNSNGFLENRLYQAESRLQKIAQAISQIPQNL